MIRVGSMSLRKTIVIALLIAGCRDLGDEPSPLYYADAIEESVFRYQFDHNYSGRRYTSEFYALAKADLYWLPRGPHPPWPQFSNRRDLSVQFMKRFIHNTPPVVKYSECFIGYGPTREFTVWDTSMTRLGLVFIVSDIVPVSEHQAQVYCGYYENPLSSSVEIYYMSGERERWVVDSTALLVIS